MPASISHLRPVLQPPPPAQSRSIVAATIAGFVAVCAALPYALVALALRVVMARVFFLAGQAKITGPLLPIHFDVPYLPSVDLVVVLPTDVSSETITLFESQYANLPLSPTVAAYLFGFAEFVLPVCLVIGFATRFAALSLIALTALTSIYAMPEAFWSTHVYWFGILLVLVSAGPGAISVDGIIRHVYEKR
jgi:putative oxidoreductase